MACDVLGTTKLELFALLKQGVQWCENEDLIACIDIFELRCTSRFVVHGWRSRSRQRAMSVLQASRDTAMPAVQARRIPASLLQAGSKVMNIPPPLPLLETLNLARNELRTLTASKPTSSSGGFQGWRYCG